MFEKSEEIISRYIGPPEREIRRYRSWSLFYHFFNDPDQDHRHDSAHLVAYLASWGMYRGSSSLLRAYDYAVHDGVIAIIRRPEYAALKGASAFTYRQDTNVKLLFKLVKELKAYYKGQTPSVGDTNTLISKILLGCLACVPAYDENFKNGLRSMGWRIGVELNEQAFRLLLKHLADFPALEFRCHQRRDYPFFKLIDMYFFQLGLEMRQLKLRHKSPRPGRGA